MECYSMVRNIVCQWWKVLAKIDSENGKYVILF